MPGAYCFRGVSPPSPKRRAEREQKKKIYSKHEAKEMGKRILSIALVAVIGVLTLSIGLHSTLGLTVHIDGDDWGYYDYQDPYFVECYHTTYPGDYYNTEVGLGITVKYTRPHTGMPTFNWGKWFFEDEAGGNQGSPIGYYYRMFTPLYCTACVNGNQYCYYSDYTTPQWGQPPGAWFNCLYVYREASGGLNYVSSAEGVTTAQFYQVDNPSNTHFLSAYTQNPPGKPGNGWSFLTAHW